MASSIARHSAAPWSRLDRNFTELEIRRAFTVFKLMAILKEAHDSLMQGCHKAAAESTVNYWLPIYNVLYGSVNFI
jgi:hypothetical protein